MKNTGTLYSLQFLRFVAAIMVMLLHLELYKSGYKGVDVFFVISGYVMYYTSFILVPKNGRTFIINRLTKIFVLYWISMLLLYLFFPFSIDSSLIKTLLLLPGHRSVLGVSWSLSYELYFYAIFAGSFYLLPKKYFSSVFIILFISCSTVTLLNTSSFYNQGSILNFLAGQNFWEFLIGILAAYSVHSLKVNLKPFALILTAFLSSISILLINISMPSASSSLLYGSLSVMIIVSFTKLEILKPVHPKYTKWISVAGDASYAIYLTAPIISKMIMPDTYLLKLLVISITIIVSILVNKLLENPILNTVRNKLKQCF